MKRRRPQKPAQRRPRRPVDPRRRRTGGLGDASVAPPVVSTPTPPPIVAAPFEPLIGPKEVAHMMSVSLNTVHRLVATKALPCVRIGRRTVRFHRHDIIERLRPR